MIWNQTLIHCPVTLNNGAISFKADMHRPNFDIIEPSALAYMKSNL